MVIITCHACSPSPPCILYRREPFLETPGPTLCPFDRQSVEWAVVEPEEDGGEEEEGA
jgi:hypothetical protein